MTPAQLSFAALGAGLLCQLAWQSARPDETCSRTTCVTGGEKADRDSDWTVMPVLTASLLPPRPFALPSQDERSTADWIEELRGSQPDAAIAALARQGRAAVRPLGMALEEADPEFAWQLQRSLRAVGDQGTSGASRLMRLLRDEDQPVHRRVSAAAALGGIGKKARSSLKNMLRMLERNAPAEVQLALAVAITEIGQPGDAELVKALKDKDVLKRIWAVSLLMQTPPSSKKVQSQLVKIVETLPFGDDRNDHLLYPMVHKLLIELEVDFFTIPIAGLMKRDSGLRSGKDPEGLRLYRGGQLDAKLLDDPSALRDLLREHLALEGDGEPMELALDGIVLDRNSDEAFSTSELVQGLCERMAYELKTQRGELPLVSSWARWREESAGILGLITAVNQVTDAAFLEKTKCLYIFNEPFDGFFPPEGAVGF